MQQKKLLIGVLALALLVGIVSAAVIIQSWYPMATTTYSVKETTTAWTTVETLDLGALYGKETKSGSEVITVSTTTYAPINFYFAVSTASKLAGLKGWSVVVSYDNGAVWVPIVGTLASVYPTYIGQQLSGSLTYSFKFDYSATANDYGPFTGGTIIVSCETQIP